MRSLFAQVFILRELDATFADVFIPEELAGIFGAKAGHLTGALMEVFIAQGVTGWVISDVFIAEGLVGDSWRLGCVRCGAEARCWQK